jgi:hypothetical protein
MVKKIKRPTSYSKKFKIPRQKRELKTSQINEIISSREENILEQNDINEYINGLKILNNFISETSINNEMTFIKLPFHMNLIRKTIPANYTKIYRKRMAQLIGFGNRFGPHYHKDETGHIYSMEYTDRINSKSLIYFRCQLKGRRAKGVLNYNNKNFFINQKHALSYENHLTNKKSIIKKLIEKTFAEKSYIKDIQIIFCRFHEDMKKKQKLNLITNFNFDLNNNNNLKEINLEKKLIEMNENKNIISFRKGNYSENENNNEENYELENHTNNNILFQRELTKGEIFWYYYDNKYKTGVNKYEEYINKIILANKENERETREFFYEIEMKLNTFKNNKNFFFILKKINFLEIGFIKI